MNRLIDFSFYVHSLLVKVLDPLPVALTAGFGLIADVVCFRCSSSLFPKAHSDQSSSRRGVAVVPCGIGSGRDLEYQRL